MIYPGLHDLIKRCLEEDMGHGDITTQSLIPATQISQAILYAKAEGVIAGIEVCRAVFQYLDPDFGVLVLKNDGDKVRPGDTIASLEGNSRALLTGERTALNFLQHLSGIATQTRQMTELIKYSKAELLDTRKTTPGLRVLEKYAVSVGGARNHRFGLYDGVMIKDNHIKAAGSILKAVSLVRQKVPHTVRIEVEVENLEQLREALEAKADIILLDNMDTTTMKEAVALTNGQALLEASGNITAANLAEAAKTGVDFISMGALTHSASNLDISLDILV